MTIKTGTLTAIAHSNNYQAAGIKVQGNSTPATSLTIDADSIYVEASSDGNPTPATDGSVRGAAAAISVLSEGNLTINGDLVVRAGNNALAIEARGGRNTKLTINKDNNRTTKIYGDIGFTYVKATSGTEADATLDINLNGSNSLWEGNSYLDTTETDIPEGYGTITGFGLTMSDGATWTTDKTSFVNTLTVNDAVINVKGGAEQAVTIDSVSGSGATINLATKQSANGYETAKVEFDADNVAKETSFNVVSSGANTDSADVAAVMEALNKGVSNVNKILTVSEGDINGAVTQAYDANGNAQGEAKTLTNTKQGAYQTLTATNILAWRHDMNDLTKRMGELRDSPEGVGAWARVYGSEQESGSQNMLTKSTSVQVGGDVDVGNGWKVGVAFSYTDSDTSYSLGSADSDSYAAAVYGSWLAENGQFVDLIAKYTRMSSDFTLNGFDGSNDNNAFSVSAEYGWHFPVNDIAFVEPQVELTYGHISGDKFASNSGTTIDQDDYESLIGRAGLRFGFYFPEHRGTIYARVSGVYDFMGEYEYTATKPNLTKRFKDDLGGAWVEYAVGANFNWTENTYTYVDLERTSGGEVKENYRWNIGLRHVF